MVDHFQVNSYSVPVLYKPEVCIIGAGAAGISAAIGAARANMSVLIVEKYGFCGGATVAGLSGTICGLYSSGNHPEQIVFGFADEFYRALKFRGGVHDPVGFGRTKLIPHDSLVWKETADNFLTGNGCSLLYHTQFLRAFTNSEGRITHLLFQGKEGQFAVEPKFVIDASGDAEVVDSISGLTWLGNKGVVQTPTMIFKMANVNIPEFLHIDPAEIDQKVADADRSGAYNLPRHHVYIFPLPNSGEVLCNMTRITYPDGSIPLGTSSADLTYAEIEGRKQAREYARFLVNQLPAFQHAYLSDTGTQIGIRQTRSIVGESILRNDDVIQARKNKNAVTFSAWPIESHGSQGVKIVYVENDHYDIPFETLIPRHSINLLVAGRCMSAEHEALASARVTAQCFGMGYAVGAACSLMKKEKMNAAQLSGVMIKDWMKKLKLKTANEQ
jgi:hypothetical protein